MAVAADAVEEEVVAVAVAVVAAVASKQGRLRVESTKCQRAISPELRGAKRWVAMRDISTK